ncbi:tetratricopeptide repeat protein [Sphingomonas sp.]|uniref:tetratricopeptide repeat protein n=1 Tax=Sphingomonas sp. TaxID=28214 RepID=UPI0025DC2B77|nr:tetratricopeptide repeat protein [Sphingomonas sp.]
MTLDDLNEMDPEALRDAVSASPEQLVAVLRVAAGAGDAEAQLLLAQAALDGKGMAADPREALEWFHKAAQAGSTMAMNMIGRCCEHGRGVAVDKAAAAQWYRAAADRGLDWGMYNLASLTALGNGVPEDRAGALALFRKAAAMGHAKSINIIGNFHEDGWVVERDMAIAADHYLRSAEGGDFRGMFNHARMLLARGDRADAVRWLDRIPETATAAFMAKARQWLRDNRPDISCELTKAAR